MIALNKWSLLQKGKLSSKFGAMVMGIVLMVACNDDDENVDAGNSASNVRIVEVDAANDQVTLKNFGEGDADISDFFFCNQRNYVAVSQTTNDGADLNLAQNEEITFTIPIDDNASDVAIYNTGGSFASTSAMVDFMQYGGSFTSTGRENVAVEKGIWTAGEFVEGGSPFTYGGDGTTTGASTWESTTDTSIGESNVRLILVNSSSNEVTLKNFGDADADISGYIFCNRRVYTAFSGTANNGSDLILSSDEEIIFTIPIDDEASDVSIYSSNAFTSADAMVDFMQYGGSFTSTGRENVAVEKGIWTVGEFVTNAGPLGYTGDGDQNGASFWE
ncbi:MAG: hypothetical protein AAF620_08715 [Bacteroidota bacterium]